MRRARSKTEFISYVLTDKDIGKLQCYLGTFYIYKDPWVIEEITDSFCPAFDIVLLFSLCSACLPVQLLSWELWDSYQSAGDKAHTLAGSAQIMKNPASQVFLLLLSTTSTTSSRQSTSSSELSCLPSSPSLAVPGLGELLTVQCNVTVPKEEVGFQMGSENCPR